MVTKVTRYAIRVRDTKTGERWWYSQGLPTKYDIANFGMAILYATPEHATKSTKKWKLQYAIERGLLDYEIVPIVCEVPND
jgi:hypothetical protein